MNYDANTAASSPEDPTSPATEKQELADINIAKAIMRKYDGEDCLKKIGRDCKAGFDADNKSRTDWISDIEEWVKIAKQYRETKSWPWDQASNIKYPLISTAAMQFSARAYPSLVPADGNIVRTRVIGEDPDGSKTDKATRASKYMSWQLMYQMPRWEEDMDRLLMMVSVMGMMFKKTFYSKEEERAVSCLVYPENFVVDYWAESLEEAERYSEIIYISKRRLKNKQNAGIYLDCNLGEPTTPKKELDAGMPAYPTNDSVTPYRLISQACWLDLNDDGLDEPYTVVFHYDTARVLGIYPRFNQKNVKLDDKGNICHIKADCYYTKFGFIPNPDGSFYDIGFGHLLGPLNDSVNTLVNQLVDAGTLANLQAGFIGKGLRLRLGDTPLQPGEWRAVNAVGDDLRKQIVPLPIKDPSKTLFDLLQFLITAGKELASVAEIFVGKMPGQNTPATTTMASIDQGMKVFTSIYKRVYRALEHEFKKLFDINSCYLDYDTYVELLGDQKVNPGDFDNKLFDIIPAADPASASSTEKLQKAQALLELMQLGTLDPAEVTMRILQAQEQPDWQKLIPGLAQTGKPQIQPKVDPKVQAIQEKAKAEAAQSQQEQQQDQQRFQLEQQGQQADLAAKQQENQMNLQGKQAELQMKAVEGQQTLQAKMASNAVDQQHQQTMNQQAQQHGHATNKVKEEALRTKATSQTGNSTKSQKHSSNSSKKR
jgi:chaperonin GroES